MHNHARFLQDLERLTAKSDWGSFKLCTLILSSHGVKLIDIGQSSTNIEYDKNFHQLCLFLKACDVNFFSSIINGAHSTTTIFVPHPQRHRQLSLEQQFHSQSCLDNSKCICFWTKSHQRSGFAQFAVNVLLFLAVCSYLKSQKINENIFKRFFFNGKVIAKSETLLKQINKLKKKTNLLME